MNNNNLKNRKSTVDAWNQKIDEIFTKRGLKSVWVDRTVSNVIMYPKPSKEQESLSKSANINKKSEKL